MQRNTNHFYYGYWIDRSSFCDDRDWFDRKIDDFDRHIVSRSVPVYDHDDYVQPFLDTIECSSVFDGDCDCGYTPSRYAVDRQVYLKSLDDSKAYNDVLTRLKKLILNEEDEKWENE